MKDPTTVILKCTSSIMKYYSQTVGHLSDQKTAVSTSPVHSYEPFPL